MGLRDQLSRRRVIWLARAESVLPRGKSIEVEEESFGSGGAATALARTGSRDRADVEAFPKTRLERAVVKLFEADGDLPDARPDDSIVMEKMILGLTAR